MTELKKGNFCISMAGHDKGTIYMVLENNGQMAEVVDGKFKTLNSPKKKNLKHLKVIEYKDDILNDKISANKLRDEDIKYSIKKYWYLLEKQEVNKCQNQM